MSIAPAADPPVAPSAWSLREPVTALTSERLAVLVQRAATRAREVLFTATPSEELDAIGSWQRLMDLAWAGQVRAVREAYNALEGRAPRAGRSSPTRLPWPSACPCGRGSRCWARPWA